MRSTQKIARERSPDMAADRASTFNRCFVVDVLTDYHDSRIDGPDLFFELRCGLCPLCRVNCIFSVCASSSTDWASVPVKQVVGACGPFVPASIILDQYRCFGGFILSQHMDMRVYLFKIFSERISALKEFARASCTPVSFQKSSRRWLPNASTSQTPNFDGVMSAREFTDNFN